MNLYEIIHFFLESLLPLGKRRGSLEHIKALESDSWGFGRLVEGYYNREEPIYLPNTGGADDGRAFCLTFLWFEGVMHCVVSNPSGVWPSNVRAPALPSVYQIIWPLLGSPIDADQLKVMRGKALSEVCNQLAVQRRQSCTQGDYWFYDHTVSRPIEVHEGIVVKANSLLGAMLLALRIKPLSTGTDYLDELLYLELRQQALAKAWQYSVPPASPPLPPPPPPPVRIISPPVVNAQVVEAPRAITAQTIIDAGRCGLTSENTFLVPNGFDEGSHYFPQSLWREFERGQPIHLVGSGLSLMLSKEETKTIFVLVNLCKDWPRDVKRRVMNVKEFDLFRYETETDKLRQEGFLEENFLKAIAVMIGLENRGIGLNFLCGLITTQGDQPYAGRGVCRAKLSTNDADIGRCPPYGGRDPLVKALLLAMICSAPDLGECSLFISEINGGTLRSAAQLEQERVDQIRRAEAERQAQLEQEQRELARRAEAERQARLVQEQRERTRRDAEMRRVQAEQERAQAADEAEKQRFREIFRPYCDGTSWDSEKLKGMTIAQLKSLEEALLSLRKKEYATSLFGVSLSFLQSIQKELNLYNALIVSKINYLEDTEGLRSSLSKAKSCEARDWLSKRCECLEVLAKPSNQCVYHDSERWSAYQKLLHLDAFSPSFNHRGVWQPWKLSECFVTSAEELKWLEDRAKESFFAPCQKVIREVISIREAWRDFLIEGKSLSSIQGGLHNEHSRITAVSGQILMAMSCEDGLDPNPESPLNVWRARGLTLRAIMKMTGFNRNPSQHLVKNLYFLMCHEGEASGLDMDEAGRIMKAYFKLYYGKLFLPDSGWQYAPPSTIEEAELIQSRLKYLDEQLAWRPIVEAVMGRERLASEIRTLEGTKETLRGQARFLAGDEAAAQKTEETTDLRQIIVQFVSGDPDTSQISELIRRGLTLQAVYFTLIVKHQHTEPEQDATIFSVNEVNRIRLLCGMGAQDNLTEEQKHNLNKAILREEIKAMRDDFVYGRVEAGAFQFVFKSEEAGTRFAQMLRNQNYNVPSASSVEVKNTKEKCLGWAVSLDLSTFQSYLELLYPSLQADQLRLFTDNFIIFLAPTHARNLLDYNDTDDVRQFKARLRELLSGVVSDPLTVLFSVVNACAEAKTKGVFNGIAMFSDSDRENIRNLKKDFFEQKPSSVGHSGRFFPPSGETSRRSGLTGERLPSSKPR